MDGKSLMIGDWVTFKDCQHENPIPIKIVGIGYQGNDGEENECLVQINGDEACDIIDIDGEIVGIPLTAEILEKNGFKKCDEDNDGAVMYEFGNEILGISVWVNTKPCLFGSWRTWSDATQSYSMVEELPINYVHELQHALRLCGIEKSIEL